MLTGGQLSSLSTGGGAVSPTACDFEPNSWLNLVPIEGLESEEAPNMLPPPHPDRTAPATASESATRQYPARPAPIVRIISLLRIIQMFPRRPYAFGARSKGAHAPRVITAQSRRTQGVRNKALKTTHASTPKRGLTAKIFMQQAKQQMVLPDPVDAEIALRQSLAAEAAFLQHPDRGRVGGNAGGFDAVKIEFAEQRRQQHAQRCRHVAAMGMGLPDPVSDRAGLHDAAADIRQRHAADHGAVGFPEHQERIGTVGGNVFGIAPQPPPEAGAGQIVGRPDRLPGCQIFPAGFA